MKRAFAAVAVVGLILTSGASAIAGDVKTVTGEVIDLDCYAKNGDKSTGDDYKACALTSSKQGSPMGILAEDGIYRITGKVTGNNNAKIFGLLAKQVSVTGEVSEQDGKKSIAVTNFKLSK